MKPASNMFYDSLANQMPLNAAEQQPGFAVSAFTLRQDHFQHIMLSGTISTQAPRTACAPLGAVMTNRTLLQSPFGVFYGGARPAAPSRVINKKLWRKSTTQMSSEPSQSIYLLDPPPAIVRMVEQICLTDFPSRYYLTCWQAPGGIQHTKISFLVDSPEEALRLLQTAAQAWEQQVEPVRQ